MRGPQIPWQYILIFYCTFIIPKNACIFKDLLINSTSSTDNGGSGAVVVFWTIFGATGRGFWRIWTRSLFYSFEG